MSFPSSPSSQGAQSPSAGSAPASSPALNSIDTISSGQSAPQTSAGAPSAGGAVRRKPTRRANTAERRATHNAVERQRRETLNGRFLDLAALLPNLATVRRPSKSAIVNSSIALVRSQRRLRAIHARQVQQLVRDAESLRREVNEWRAAHPHEPVPSARASLSSPSTPLEPVVELHYAPEIASLLDMEDTSAAEDRMNEQERIAYEMRGGDSGPLGASIVEDGEDDLNEEDGPSSYTGVPTMAAPATAPDAIPRQHNLQQQLQQHPAPAQLPQVQPPMELTAQQLAAAASLVPSAYPGVAARQQQQQQQQQFALQQQMQRMASLGLFPTGPMGMPMGGMGMFGAPQPFIPASFDSIAAAASSTPTTPVGPAPAFGQQQHPMQTPNPTPMSEQDAAKYAAWNAHLFSAALVAQQQQRDQQAQQFFQQQQQQHKADSASSSPSPSLSGAPSLSLSSSPSSSSVLSISTSDAGLDMGLPGSLPSASALNSPLDGLSLANQQQDAFGFAASYPGASATAWKDVPVAAGNGGSGFLAYPMMAPFM